MSKLKLRGKLVLKQCLRVYGHRSRAWHLSSGRSAGTRAAQLVPPSTAALEETETETGDRGQSESEKAAGHGAESAELFACATPALVVRKHQAAFRQACL